MSEEVEDKVKKGGSLPVGQREKLKWHSDARRIQAAAAYAATGSNAKAAELSGVPAGTIAQWKTQDWWPDLLERVRKDADDELDTKLTRNTDKIVEKINDRLEKGDWFYNPITGAVERKEIGAKDLGILLSIHAEKRDLLRNKKAIRSDTQTINQRLEKIAEDVRRLVGGAKIIEGEIISKEVEVDANETDAVSAQDTPQQGQEILDVRG